MNKSPLKSFNKGLTIIALFVEQRIKKIKSDDRFWQLNYSSRNAVNDLELLVRELREQAKDE